MKSKTRSSLGSNTLPKFKNLEHSLFRCLLEAGDFLCGSVTPSGEELALILVWMFAIFNESMLGGIEDPNTTLYSLSSVDT